MHSLRYMPVVTQTKAWSRHNPSFVPYTAIMCSGYHYLSCQWWPYLPGPPDRVYSASLRCLVFPDISTCAYNRCNTSPPLLVLAKIETWSRMLNSSPMNPWPCHGLTHRCHTQSNQVMVGDLSANGFEEYLDCQYSRASSYMSEIACLSFLCMLRILYLLTTLFKNCPDSEEMPYTRCNWSSFA